MNIRNLKNVRQFEKKLTSENKFLDVRKFSNARQSFLKCTYVSVWNVFSALIVFPKVLHFPRGASAETYLQVALW